MEKSYLVKNRSASVVVYVIPEEGIRREFMPGESKRIEKSELDKLSFQPGGRELMTSFLQIAADEIIKEFNIPAEPEYFMNEQQVAELIAVGSLDAFLDCLDFAPKGVIDLIKKFAIDMPMTDTQKIQALKEKTGFDVAKALEMKRAEKEDEQAPTEGHPERRVVQEEPSTGRRTTAPKYKVVG